MSFLINILFTKQNIPKKCIIRYHLLYFIVFFLLKNSEEKYFMIKYYLEN